MIDLVGFLLHGIVIIRNNYSLNWEITISLYNGYNNYSLIYVITFKIIIFSKNAIYLYVHDIYNYVFKNTDL